MQARRLVKGRGIKGTRRREKYIGIKACEREGKPVHAMDYLKNASRSTTNSDRT